MENLKKFFACFCIAILLISSSVLATDINNGPVDDVADVPMLISESPNTTATPVTAESIYKDLYIYDTNSYSLSDIVYGNVFASTTKFVTNPKNNGGIISGNLYLISSEAVIESDVAYSNNKDKNGNYIVNSINEKSIINGNAYVLSDTFTLQAGSEIHGDLYVAANTVNIEQDAVVDGNLFVTASEVNLNGQVSGSAYITTDTFNMTYFTYITRDLYLNCNNATLAGVVYRNAFITAYDKLLTESDFRVSQDLSVDFAKDFTFSGEVQGNAEINAKNLAFKNDNSEKCIIRGNLKYATESNTEIPDGIVSGQVTTDKYVEKTNNKLSLKSLVFSFFTLLVYVLAIVFLARVFTANAVSKLDKVDLKNTLISLGIGLVSMFAITILFILLVLCGIGISLAFFFIVGYLLILGLAVPLFLYNIADMIKLNLNIYVKLLIVTAVLYAVSLIPVFGSGVVFIVLLVGIGRILLTLFNRRK